MLPDDRLYLRGFEAKSLQIVGNKEVTPGAGDCLSDHFALLATLRVSEGPVPARAAAAAAAAGSKRPLSPRSRGVAGRPAKSSA